MIAIDPLGVFAFTAASRATARSSSIPQPEPLNSFTLSGADRYGWQEFTAAALRGASVDPDGVREYAPGDPLRRIHWRQTARTGQARRHRVRRAADRQSGDRARPAAGHGRRRGTGRRRWRRASRSRRRWRSRRSRPARACVSSCREDAAADERAVGLVRRRGRLPNRGQEHLLAVLDALARAEARSARPVSQTGQRGRRQPAAGHDAGRHHARRPTARWRMRIARYTSAQTRVGVDLCGSGGLCERRAQPIAPSTANRFFAEILAVHAHPFLMHRATAEEPTPETILHGTF